MELTIYQALQKGIEAHQEGQAQEADRLYTAILKAQPKHPDANHNMGVLAVGVDKVQEALPFFKTALEVNPSIAQYWLSYIDALIRLGHLDDARIVLEQARDSDTDGEAFVQLSDRLEQATLAENEEPSQEQIQELINLYNQGQLAAALDQAEILIQQYPKAFVVWNILGAASKGLGNLAEASKAFKKVTELNPNYADGFSNLGVVLTNQGKLDEALDVLKKALSIKPDHADAHYNMGNALKDKGELDAAIDSYKQAIKIKPDHANAYCNMGNALKDKVDLDAAIDSYNQAIKIKPDHADAYNNMGNAFNDKGDFDAAIDSLKQAIKIKPDCAEAYTNMGNALKDKGELELAMDCYKKAIKIKPRYPEASTQACKVAAQMADWVYVSKIKDNLLYKQNEVSLSVYGLLALEDRPTLFLEKMTKLVRAKYQYIFQYKHRPFQKSKRIKVGYFSSYFRQHPVSTLSVQMLEYQNKEQFETYAFHYGPDNNDDYNLRMRDTFNHFINVSKMSDKDIAQLACKKGIDIAIDFNGFMRGCRVGIFAHRPAPIQINYLAYPWTMGASFYDYIIADHTVIPEEQRDDYSENIIYLPNCYMPQDNTRQISNKKISRIDCGLADYAFVFCCFNNSFKISPKEFDIWMRLLSKVEKSSLWLLKYNRWAEVNLKAEARKRGIDPVRLVFADHLPFDEHLGRFKLADLFLDTFNFNAHTTASDALWAGLPVITKMGKGFSARVAGSLLTALELPEMITTSEKEYEQLALDLALKPDKLVKIRNKLNEKRLSAPLFDTESYTQNLEKAYKIAYQRYVDGLQPAEFKVV